jgi:hypothetical protein
MFPVLLKGVYLLLSFWHISRPKYSISLYDFPSSFLELYGDKVCSMNCLVLTDEEAAEYGSFESLIGTNEKFESSNVMLCIFHAIWQPLKRDIYPLCPRKSKKGKPLELSKVGSAWGE